MNVLMDSRIYVISQRHSVNFSSSFFLSAMADVVAN